MSINHDIFFGDNTLRQYFKIQVRIGNIAKLGHAMMISQTLLQDNNVACIILISQNITKYCSGML